MLSVLKILRTLSRERLFVQEMNVKLYFDVMTAVIRHLTVESFKLIALKDEARDDD